MCEQCAKLARGDDLAKAIDYIIKRSDAFTLFLDDGRVCLSNNAAERALRGIALGRKSWMFCGSDEGASCCSSGYLLKMKGYFEAGFEVPGVLTAGGRLRALHGASQYRHVEQSRVRFCRVVWLEASLLQSSGGSLSGLYRGHWRPRSASLPHARPVRHHGKSRCPSGGAVSKPRHVANPLIR